MPNPLYQNPTTATLAFFSYAPTPVLRNVRCARVCTHGATCGTGARAAARTAHFRVVAYGWPLLLPRCSADDRGPPRNAFHYTRRAARTTRVVRTAARRSTPAAPRACTGSLLNRTTRVRIQLLLRAYRR
jgi:hypothetical protein